MSDFQYQEMFPHGADATPYRKLDGDWVGEDGFRGQRVLTIDVAALTQLAYEAVRDVSHLFRPGHLAQLARILDDPEASTNDRFVALNMLRNACVSAGMVLPPCQDTGTAIVIGKKGQRVWTSGDDATALTRGIYDVYQQTNLRYSQMAPLSTFEEKNTGTNLPAQLELHATGGDEYHLLFITKGGGSANKSLLFQETAAILERSRLLAFLEHKVKQLGTAACPPYHLAVVIGGTSAEATMKTVKLASCRDLDDLPTQGDETGYAIRDPELEDTIWKMTQRLEIGAQFGGKYFCHDVRVIRLPRHGASLPIGIGVSCSADRQAKAKITRDGVFLEQLEANPAQYVPDVDEHKLSGHVVHVDLSRPMSEIRQTLSQYPIKTRLALSGPLIVARDLAHAKLRDALEKGTPLP